MAGQHHHFAQTADALRNHVTILTTHIVDTDLLTAWSVDGSSGVYTITLGDGAFIGQQVFFNCTVAGNDVTLSVTKHLTSNPELIVLNAVDESALLVWNGTEWHTVVLNGATTP